MAVPNSNYANDLAASTLEIFARNLPMDVIFKDIPLWESLKANNRVRMDGGRRIEEPLMYAKSTAVGAYQGYDTLDVSPQAGLTNADFDWKQYFGTVTIAGDERRKNQGKMAMINLLDTKWEQAKMSLADRLGQDIYLDGVGTGAETGKTITGLALAVDSAGTYGNISRSANSWWSSVETAVGGVLVLNGSTGMRKMFNDIRRGQRSATANLILTTQTGFESYEALSDSGMRFTTSGEGQVTYSGESLMYKGARLTWDQYCQSGVMYFLNTKHMSLVVMENMQGPDYKGDFAYEPLMKTPNQDAETAKFLWMGNLTSNNCARQGKLAGITNA